MNSPLQFRVLSMDCAEEVTALKRQLVPLVGDEQRLLEVLSKPSKRSS